MVLAVVVFVLAICDHLFSKFVVASFISLKEVVVTVLIASSLTFDEVKA
jgi:hypothetical protein